MDSVIQVSMQLDGIGSFLPSQKHHLLGGEDKILEPYILAIIPQNFDCTSGSCSSKKQECDGNQNWAV